MLNVMGMINIAKQHAIFGYDLATPRLSFNIFYVFRNISHVNFRPVCVIR